MAAVEAQARGDRGVCPGSGKPRLQEEGLTVVDPLERRLCLSERARAAQETRLAAGRVERELATVRAYLAGDGPPGIQPVPRGRHLCSTGRCGRCWLWRAADFKINWRGVACARHTAGMAEDWIDLDGFARLLGHADQRTLSSWRARGVPAGHPVPEPDDVVVERGHARPRWRRATVEAWMAARPGRGRRRADR